MLNWGSREKEDLTLLKTLYWVVASSSHSKGRQVIAAVSGPGRPATGRKRLAEGWRLPVVGREPWLCAVEVCPSPLYDVAAVGRHIAARRTTDR